MKPDPLRKLALVLLGFTLAMIVGRAMCNAGGF